MDDVIGELASWQLDRKRPLWECWILDGLADDLDDPTAGPPSGAHVGFLVKMHHAMADGVAAAALLANVMETAADAVDPPPPVEPWRSEPVPPAWRLLLDAIVDGVAACAACRRSCAAPSAAAGRGPAPQGGRGVAAAADPAHRRTPVSTARLTPSAASPPPTCRSTT